MHELGLRMKSSGQKLSKVADDSLTSAVSGRAINALRGLYAEESKSGERLVLQSASSMHNYNSVLNAGAANLVGSTSEDNYFKLDFGDIMGWLIMMLISNNEGSDKYGCTLDQLDAGETPLPIKLAFALDGGKQSEHKGNYLSSKSSMFYTNS